MKRKRNCAAMLGFICAVLFINPGLLASTGGQVKYDSLVRSLSDKHGVSSQLVHSIIKAESNYNPFAVSSKGAKGLMQLMPGTAKDYGVSDVYDPEENIEAGIKHIKFLLTKYSRNLNMALAAYNAGPEAVEKYNGIPPYPETQKYIAKINASMNAVLVRTNKQIYSYYNESGRLVLTNIPHLRKTDIRKIFKK
ncbi:lytic transglycosylase domain-containing protein [Acidobacteriota bacterium]